MLTASRFSTPAPPRVVMGRKICDPSCNAVKVLGGAAAGESAPRCVCVLGAAETAPLSRSLLPAGVVVETAAAAAAAAAAAGLKSL